jgi:hypothetical protein
MEFAMKQATMGKADQQDEDLMNGLENLVLHGERMPEASEEAQKSHIFKTNEWCVSAGIKEYEDRQIHNFVISEEETTLSHPISQRESYACSKNAGVEEDGDVQRTISWLGDTSVDEVDEILEWAIQDYNDASMELAKEEMTVRDNDGDNDHWYRIMEKGMKCLLQICHFNQIQEQSLFDQSCRLSMQLKDMQDWVHKFLFSEKCSQRVEDRQRYEDEEMEATIQHFCDDLQQNCSSDVYQQGERLDIELDELWKHLINISKWKYQRQKKMKKRSMQIQPTEERKEFSQQQSKVWDPGRLLTTTRQQQGNNADGQQHRWRNKQLQHKVWDPGGLQQMKTHDQEIMKYFNPGSLMQEHFPSQNNLVD